jgi:hypothetical protein
MPALLNRNRSSSSPAEAERSEAVAAVLANLQHSFDADQPRVSRRELRHQARDRARDAERHVWVPLRTAAAREHRGW